MIFFSNLFLLSVKKVWKIKRPCLKIFKISTSEESYAKNMNIINLHSINVWFKDKSSTIEELRISSVQRWLFYIFGGEQFVILWKRWSPLWDEEDKNLQVYLNLWKRHKYPKIGRSKTLDFGRVCILHLKKGKPNKPFLHFWPKMYLLLWAKPMKNLQCFLTDAWSNALNSCQ